MSSSLKTVVVAQGVIGRNVAEYYASQQGWKVVGLSRREPYGDEHFDHVRVDLLNSGDTAEKLRRYADATHLVFAAYIEKPTAQELVTPNVAMLRNFLNAFDTNGAPLEHITFYQGGKAYGAHLGPFKTPGREDDPRHMPPNFYYNQEDFLRERQANSRWTWTALRPEAVCGFALRNPGLRQGSRVRRLAGVLRGLALVGFSLSRPSGLNRRPKLRKRHPQGLPLSTLRHFLAVWCGLGSLMLYRPGGRAHSWRFFSGRLPPRFGRLALSLHRPPFRSFGCRRSDIGAR
jgi:hypothetical protein